jgi:transcriptional regulator with XRE-family HTH domain
MNEAGSELHSSNTLLSLSEPARKAAVAMRSARFAARDNGELVAGGEKLRFSNKTWAELLARALGLVHLTTQAVSSWETGRVRVPAEALIAAAQLSGRSLDFLIQESRDGSDTQAIVGMLRAVANEIQRTREKQESGAAKKR